MSWKEKIVQEEIAYYFDTNSDHNTYTALNEIYKHVDQKIYFEQIKRYIAGALLGVDCLFSAFSINDQHPAHLAVQLVSTIPILYSLYHACGAIASQIEKVNRPTVMRNYLMGEIQIHLKERQLSQPAETLESRMEQK